jgi:choline-glycine betaine transporter
MQFASYGHLHLQEHGHIEHVYCSNSTAIFQMFDLEPYATSAILHALLIMLLDFVRSTKMPKPEAESLALR